jgi:hypothetical protein
MIIQFSICLMNHLLNPTQPQLSDPLPVAGPPSAHLTQFTCRHHLVVSAGKLRKLWDSQSELRSSLCKRELETQACAIACQNCAVYSVYPSGMTTSHSITAHFDCKCMDQYRENIFANQKQNSVLPLVLLCTVLSCVVSKTWNSSFILQ